MNSFRWIPSIAILLAGAGALAQAPPAAEPDLFSDDPLPLEAQRARVVQQANRSNPPVAPPGYRHALLFSNGRQLRGELARVSKDVVVWQRTDASEPLRFPRAEVRRILLAPDNPAKNDFQFMMPQEELLKVPSQPLLATVQLPGGDWLRGSLASPDGEKFALSLNGAAPIQVARKHVDWLSFGVKPAPAFVLGSGALALEGWLSDGSARVEARDGALTVHDTTWIGRRLPGPSRFEVDLELPEGSEDGLRLWLQPFHPQPNSYSSGTVQFCFGSKALKWLIFHDDIQPNDLPLPAEAQAEPGPVRYRIFYDGTGQRVILLRNGRQLGDWSLRPKVEQPGMDRRQRLPRGLTLDHDHQRQETPLQFRRLSMMPWDGVLPKADEPKIQEDRLSTPKAATRLGRLQGVREKEMNFAGTTVPLDEDLLVELPQTPSPLPDADALVSFDAQGQVSLADFQMSEGTVRGRSAFAATLELPATAVESIAFASRGPATPPVGDSLVFKNGDELSGALVVAGTAGTLRWRLATGQELDLKTERVAGVRLTSSVNATAAGTVELRNGDRLRGTVTAFDDRHLRWQHALLGELTMDRAQLWRLYPGSTQLPAEAGQDSAGWLRDTTKEHRFFQYNRVRPRSNSWMTLDGRFILRGSDVANGEQALGPLYEIDTACERYELRVDFTSLGQNPGGLNINFDANERAATVLRLSSYQMSLYMRNPKAGNGGNINRELPFREKIGDTPQRMSLRAFVDKRVGTIDFVVNGHLIGRTGQTAAERLPGIGKTVALDVYTNARTQVVLSQVMIAPWSGELPRAGEAGPTTVLANGDVATGVPSSLTDGLWRMESEIGPLALPAGKVQTIEFGGVMQPAPSTAKIRLVDGSALLVDRFQWSGGEFTAHHAAFGDLAIPVAAVSELIYNPPPVRPPIMAGPGKIAGKEPAPPLLR